MSDLASRSLHQLLQLALEQRLIRDVVITDTHISMYVLDGLKPVEMDDVLIREVLIHLLEHPPAGFSRPDDPSLPA